MENSNLEIRIQYAVYEFNRVMGSKEHLALTPVSFNTNHNSFDTEQEAIDALVKDGNKLYEDYIILKQVRITNY